MNGIRTLTPADVSSVISLHRLVWGAAAALSETEFATYQNWLKSVFLRPSIAGGESPSLVYEDDGKIIGFLGVVERQVTLNGRAYRAISTSNLSVHPMHRGLVGLQLLRNSLDRCGDMAFVDEVEDRPRELLERMGYVVSPAQSVRWMLPLRPAQNFTRSARHRLPSLLWPVCSVGARAIDKIIENVPGSPFKYQSTSLDSEELQCAELEYLLETFGSSAHLRPVSSDGSTAWLISRAREMKQHGELLSVALKDTQENVMGWYVYYAKRGATCEVLQLVAKQSYTQEVLHHLAHHAAMRGGLSLTGTLHHDFLQPLAAHRATFNPAIKSRWMMIYSKEPEIVNAFLKGDVLLSRLDGEWCQHLT